METGGSFFSKIAPLKKHTPHEEINPMEEFESLSPETKKLFTEAIDDVIKATASTLKRRIPEEQRPMVDRSVIEQLHSRVLRNDPPITLEEGIRTFHATMKKDPKGQLK